VDDVNRYPEISETNNRFELDFQVFERAAPNLPDSVVKGIGFETQPDGQVVLKADVANIGNAPTSDVVGVAFFVDGQYVTYGITQPMGIGASQTIRAVKPLSLRGAHQITAIVDDVNRYEEISHRNNVLIRELTFG
jgi:subtilase family serine protease